MADVVFVLGPGGVCRMSWSVVLLLSLCPVFSLLSTWALVTSLSDIFSVLCPSSALSRIFYSFLLPVLQSGCNATGLPAMSPIVSSAVSILLLNPSTGFLILVIVLCCVCTNRHLKTLAEVFVLQSGLSSALG